MLPLRLEQLREKLRAPLARSERVTLPAPPWFARALPDEGFPIGITELSATRALGGATLIISQSMALQQRREAESCCAWLDPEGTLHAPGLLQQGVELTRLLVVQPPRERLQAIAVRVARSGAVAMLAIDFHPVGGKRAPAPARQADERWVRRLQLACEEGSTAALLVTDARAQQSASLPVALKLELEHLSPQRLRVTVRKERTGRVGQSMELELP
ncbi:MAG: recombinase A [Archangiaceae bacterium]|nr:recombinase A [Archangiaceae bacterium]